MAKAFSAGLIAWPTLCVRRGVHRGVDGADGTLDRVPISASLPMRRGGRPEDVGDVCAFYLSDLGAAVTGAYLPVNGRRITQAGPALSTP